MTKSKSAFLISTQILGKQSLYMWTFTFAEVLNVKGYTQTLEPPADVDAPALAADERDACF